MVTGGEGGQRNLIIAGRIAEGACLTVQRPVRFFPEWAVNISRLAEAAAAQAATQHLHHRAVVHRLYKRHHEAVRKIHCVDVPDNALNHPGRRALLRGNGADGAVVMIGNLVEGRNIHTRDLRRPPQELSAGPAGLLGLGVEIADVQHQLLALAQLKKVKKFRNRLRVAGTGAAAHDNGRKAGAVGSAQRDPRQIEHIENRGVGQLILQGKAHQVKRGHRVQALQCVERLAAFAQQLFKVRIRRKYPLAPVIRT